MKDIIIEYSPHEIRVATLEGDALTELYHERPQEKRLVGNIYKGKVANHARNAPLCVVVEGLTNPPSKFHAYQSYRSVH